jgi:hypothetical protein
MSASKSATELIAWNCTEARSNAAAKSRALNASSCWDTNRSTPEISLPSHASDVGTLGAEVVAGGIDEIGGIVDADVPDEHADVATTRATTAINRLLINEPP